MEFPNFHRHFGTICFVASLLLMASGVNSHASTIPNITLPQGFEIEVVAEAPLIGHPMMACFDDRGRLFIAEAGGTNANDEILQVIRPNFIRMIEDTDGDGKFDKSTIFADKLVIPNGALWHKGSLYVAEPPGIWRFTDTDGDGVADKREHIAGKVRSNGMSASLHGPVLDPVGRLFWCGGQQGYTLDKDKELKPGRIAPGVFTLRDDGTEHENFSVGGRANPVEVTFGPNGEVFGTVAILDAPDGARHDALMHWVYGGVYSISQNDPSPLKRTGDTLPPLSHVGQVAPAGITRYRGKQFGEEYRDSIFWAQFNTHKIVRTRITPDGATFRAQDEDFLIADAVDFHCTDILEDADGSLLVLDTGGWFRHGCPTSQIAKPDVKGAIYRIRKKGGTITKDPRGQKLDWAKSNSAALCDLLTDERPAVVDRAISELAARGNDALDALRKTLEKSENREARRNAIWAISRMRTDAAARTLRLALADKDPGVRQSAVYTTGANRDKKAAKILQSIVARDANPAIRREAAAAIGRICEPKSVPSLLAALAENNDAFLTHSLIYSLIEINDSAATKRGLNSNSPLVQRGALIALEQMDGFELNREEIARLLSSENFDVQKAAFAIADRRSDLNKEMVGMLAAWLSESEPSNEKLQFVRAALVTKALKPELEDFVGAQLTGRTASPIVRQSLLEVLAKSGQKELPASWVAGLKTELQHGNTELRLQAIDVIQQRKIVKLDDSLRILAEDQSLSTEVRIAALAAMAPRLKSVAYAHFAMLTNNLRPQSSPVQRLAAARTISSLNLSDEQILRLAGYLPEVDSLALPTVLRSFARKTDDIVGIALVSGLENATSAQVLGANEVARLLSNYSSTVQEKAKPLLVKLGADLENQRQRLKELSAAISGGDLSRGKEIFFGKKAACFSCHRISGQGGVVGPNLSKIGGIRVERDLLESVVFPSASIVQGYHTFILETTDEEEYSGIIIRDTPEAVWIRGTDLAEIRVETKKIKNMRESSLSVMPQGLDTNLSSSELRDLIAYLQSLK